MADLEGLTSDERVQLLGAWELKFFGVALGYFTLLFAGNVESQILQYRTISMSFEHDQLPKSTLIVQAYG